MSVFSELPVLSQNVADTGTFKNPLLIDTSLTRSNQLNASIDSSNIRLDTSFVPKKEIKTLTNVRALVYIILSLAGLALFYFIFISTLFRTFHKKRSTRQSMMLSWSLFFNVSVLWIFIVWGIVGELWNISSFVVVIAFLSVISLITLAFALKSK
ncbi:MAG: hypothetical protein ACP5P3_07750 [Ignavibacteria bacterium]